MIGVRNGKVDTLPLAGQRVVGSGDELVFRRHAAEIDGIAVSLPAGGTRKPVGERDAGRDPAFRCFACDCRGIFCVVLSPAGTQGEKQAKKQSACQYFSYHGLSSVPVSRSPHTAVNKNIMILEIVIKQGFARLPNFQILCDFDQFIHANFSTDANDPASFRVCQYKDILL